MMSIGEILRNRIELMKLKDSEVSGIHNIELTKELEDFMSDSSNPIFLKTYERGRSNDNKRGNIKNQRWT